MSSKKNSIAFYLPLITLAILNLIVFLGETASAKNTGEKGADIYCFMRKNGNEHEVSWNAAYALIKRQSNSLFKTSPRHAAVMIIESVVQSPTSYPDCGRYLGDLFGNSEGSNTNQNNNSSNQNNNSSALDKGSRDRYEY